MKTNLKFTYKDQPMRPGLEVRTKIQVGYTEEDWNPLAKAMCRINCKTLGGSDAACQERCKPNPLPRPW